MVTIDVKLCTNCNLCTRVCPTQTLISGPVITKRRCIECGQCFALCPTAAVTVVDFGAEEVTPAGEPISSANLLGLMSGRRSVRAYTSREVEREHLEAEMESPRAATTALLAKRGSKLFRHSGIHYLELG